MKATTYCRIKLHPKGKNMLTEAVIIAAALSNGGQYLTLKQLTTIAEGIKLQYPLLYDDITISEIEDNALFIDKRDGEEWINILFIEKIEVLEL